MAPPRRCRHIRRRRRALQRRPCRQDPGRSRPSAASNRPRRGAYRSTRRSRWRWPTRSAAGSRTPWTGAHHRGPGRHAGGHPPLAAADPPRAELIKHIAVVSGSGTPRGSAGTPRGRAKPAQAANTNPASMAKQASPIPSHGATPSGPTTPRTPRQRRVRRRTPRRTRLRRGTSPSPTLRRSSPTTTPSSATSRTGGASATG